MKLGNLLGRALPWRHVPRPENPGARMVIGVTSDGVEKPMCLDAAEYYDKQRIGPALGGGALAGSINGDVRGYQTAEERYADQAEKSRPD